MRYWLVVLQELSIWGYFLTWEKLSNSRVVVVPAW